MVIIEYLELKTRRKMSEWISQGPWRQYTLSSFLGAIPGCMGAFTSASMYIHGFLSLGAITATMIATSGDEAFVMLAKFPKIAILLFGLLMIFGLIGGFIMDFIAQKLKIKKCEECRIEKHPKEFKNLSLKHYLEDHVLEHIIKEHIPRLFLWIFGALLFIHLSLAHFNLQAIFSGLPIFVLILLAALVGLIPGSGPHLPFVFLFANGLIPFSVLLTSSIVQDGHGILPIFSYTVRDSLIVKAFNLIYAIIIGLALMIFLGV
ncbi:MAG: arsenic efflux protein [Hadesarchaea archaeon]|nr:arsenic efflux protein [Hadesarchaea archaeon]